MQLALGTVQFGLPYGVAGRGEAIPEVEARQILARAHALGIRTLDTAAAYGDIEARLAALCGDLEFDFVSKIGPAPRDLAAADSVAAMVAQAERSRQRLGARLKSLMLHRADDLLEPLGEALWPALSAWAADAGIALGASCYEPETAQRLQGLAGFTLAQLAGNALDQRVARAWPATPPFTLHLRSAFLQGLLLMPADAAVRRVPAAAAAVAAWHAWCGEQGLDTLTAALAVVKSFAAVGFCVVGVDRLQQLEEIAAAWQAARLVAAPALHCDNPAIVDPRRWSAP